MSPRVLSPALRDDYLALLDRWPVPSERRTVDTRHGETFVLSCGDANAPPVILLHGALTNAASWMFDAIPWSESFRVHVIDIVGEPGLSAPYHPDLDGGAWAEWLDDVLVRLDIARAAFVGLSFGGWIALDYARRYSAKVDRLALLAPSGIGAQRSFLWRALPFLCFGAWGRERVRRMVMGPVRPNASSAAIELMAFLHEVRSSVRPRPMRLPRLTDGELAALTMPVLAIVGGRDALLDSRETASRIERLVPDGCVDFIHDGYHYLPGQRDRIQAFLQR